MSGDRGITDKEEKMMSQKREFRIRLGAVFVCASMAFQMFNFVPVRAASNVTGTNEYDDITLLVGNNGHRGDDLASTIQYYNDNYALGIASQFCVMVEDDMEVWLSDAEGRVAVGGSFINNTDKNWHYSYPIGLGDFVTQTPLDTLIDNSGYADFIWGANSKSEDNKATAGDIGFEGRYTDEHELASDGLWTVMAVESDDGIQFINDDAYYGSSLQEQIYDCRDPKLIDFDELYGSDGLLSQRAEELAAKTSSSSVSFDWEEFSFPQYDWDGDCHLINVPKWNTGVLTLTYEGDPDAVADCVYFTLSEEDLAKFQNATVIKFENIPKLPAPRAEIDVDGKPATWEYAYIVVNIGGDIVDLGNQSRLTYINGIQTGKNWYGTSGDSRGVNGKYVWIGDADGNIEDVVESNAVGVSSILYNLHEADEVILPYNFQGTIFAPTADAHDREGGYGHLSGALIAKSFTGATEFGFRPFSGPYSMIPVSVVMTTTSNPTKQNEPLSIRAAVHFAFCDTILVVEFFLVVH